jgi:uncharacterized protein YceH (UPF0502 family)
MTTPPTDSPAPRPPIRPLDPRQRRVLGVLVEKAKTTPGAYPMTVNAIVTGCNQKNNRDPLTAYDELDVEKALDELRMLKAVSEIDWLGRVPKYKHHVYEWLGVSKAEAAVLAELLLRGAQPLGELRARAARMEPIADLAALRPIVDGLLERGLMLALTPPGRGQVVSHNLYPAAELAEAGARHPGRPEPADSGEHRESGTTPSDATPGFAAALATEIADLRAEVARLRERVGRLEAMLHEPPG